MENIVLYILNYDTTSYHKALQAHATSLRTHDCPARQDNTLGSWGHQYTPIHYHNPLFHVLTPDR